MRIGISYRSFSKALSSSLPVANQTQLSNLQWLQKNASDNFVIPMRFQESILTHKCVRLLKQMVKGRGIQVASRMFLSGMKCMCYSAIVTSFIVTSIPTLSLKHLQSRLCANTVTNVLKILQLIPALTCENQLFVASGGPSLKPSTNASTCRRHLNHGNDHVINLLQSPNGFITLISSNDSHALQVSLANPIQC